MELMEFKAIDVVNAVLVPVFLTLLLGGWLALFTANLVSLRDTKARLVTNLFGVRDAIREFDPTKVALTPTEIASLFKEVRFIEAELLHRGYIKLGTTVHEVATTSMGELLSIYFDQQPSGDADEERDAAESLVELNEQIFVGFSFRAMEHLTKRYQADRRKILECPVDWAALAELTTFAEMVRKTGQSGRSDEKGQRQV